MPKQSYKMLVQAKHPGAWSMYSAQVGGYVVMHGLGSGARRLGVGKFPQAAWKDAYRNVQMGLMSATGRRDDSFDKPSIITVARRALYANLGDRKAEKVLAHVRLWNEYVTAAADMRRKGEA